jgi:hypothetical protein
MPDGSSARQPRALQRRGACWFGCIGSRSNFVAAASHDWKSGYFL